MDECPLASRLLHSIPIPEYCPPISGHSTLSFDPRGEFGLRSRNVADRDRPPHCLIISRPNIFGNYHVRVHTASFFIGPKWYLTS